MQIKELVIKNFKSFNFAKIPFKKGFHVIVGPNGSGKSNIIDALLFAFGSTSLKKLRVDKLMDLVNHHSKTKTARCRIIFENNGEEVEVAREIDEMGRSIFFLNNKRKSLNEITSFLSELKISSDGYNTVQQGDVTRIINMNPEERRKIIEDISGISLFDERKKEAEDNLKKVDKRLEKVNIALSERRPYVEQLKQEREDALKFKELDNLETVYNVNLFNKRKIDLDKELSIEKERIEVNNEKIKTLIISKREFLEQQNQFESKIEEINSKLINHSEKVQSTIGKEHAEIKASKEIIINNINLKQENLEYLRKENNSATELISNWKKELDQVKGIVLEQENKLSEKNKVKDNLKDNIQKDKEEYEKLRSMQEELYAQLSDINSNINKVQDDFFKKKNIVSAYNLQKETLEKQDMESKENIKQLKDKQHTLKKEISSLESHISKVKSNIEKLETDYNKELEHNETLVNELNENNIELAKLKKEISFTNSVLEKKEDIKQKLSKFNSFVGFLEDVVKLNSSQKSLFSTYIVLDNEKEISKITKEIGSKVNLSFVVLSALDVKKDNLTDLFINKFNSSSSKNVKIDDFYFDGFCYKKILYKDHKDLEKKITAIEHSISKVEEKLNKSKFYLESIKTELDSKNSAKTKYEIELNTNIQFIDDVEEKLSNVTSKIQTVSVNDITKNINLENKEIIELEDLLVKSKKEKLDLEEQLKKINLGTQNSIRDQYDSIVSEVNMLEQSLISKRSQIKSIEEKINNKSEFINLNNNKVKEINNSLNEYKDSEVELNNKLNAVIEKLDKEDQVKQELFDNRSKINSKINELNQNISNLSNQISEINSEINSSNIAVSTIENKIVQVEQNINLLDKDISDIEEVDLSADELYSKLRTIRRDKNALGNINFNAIENYDKLAKEFDEIMGKYDILIEEKEQVENMLSEINMKKTTVFMDCFEKVNKEFKEIISKMSKLLSGSLELPNKENALNSKLLINITKNKKTKNIDIMSGGEKTITALAFIFAIHAYRKSPFYILDEVDAALDDYNSKSLMNYIQELSKTVTILAISHNSTLVSGADQIIGVTLKDHSSAIGLDIS